jgi:hypothetical protein
MEKLYHLPTSTTCFKPRRASVRESIHANTEICGAPANRALVREIAGEE